MATDAIQREEIDVDVLIVGAGPAGLACGYKLGKLYQAAGLDLPEIVIIEKADEVGQHSLSGAILDPRALAELMPDFIEQGMPVDAKAVSDSFVYLREKGSFTFPLNPPFLRNDGNYIISLNKFTAWLAEKVEALGVDIFTGTGGRELLIENGRVAGVQTVDMGRNPDGSQKDSFEPGSLLKAKITILAEGTRGSLTKQAYRELGIADGKVPHSYLTGIKEVWEVPEGQIKAGQIIHTFGFPQPNDEFGGGFIYGMSDTSVSIGLCTALGSPDPGNDPHMKFQRYKEHPYVKAILGGGKMIRYGAKVIAEGGYYAMPKFYHDGMLVIGESAGLLNAQRLKGVHLGIKSGELSAETVFECLKKDDFSDSALSDYEIRFGRSWAKKEMYKVRNFHAGFEGGLWAGVFHSGIQYLSGGRGLFERRVPKEDGERVMKLADFQKYRSDSEKKTIAFDNSYTYDKLTDVYNSGTMHEEHQPPHLLVADYDICSTRCVEEYGNPCQHFCPANVYNMVDDPTTPGRKILKLTPSNCVHCKTCDIADPYGIIDWVVPEGGGPNYVGM
ncbi:MAG: electron transfer flavoprotein-ubiquinone oxidoreductase [candidate division Zixibacteria bacterium]|nr:electron transfer flavoprotein-ubiquinone oxidoreductase [candidate division Zixibacteria bacterium]